MKLRTFAIAAAALVLSAGLAAAATVTNDLNLRAGPGTSYGVIDTIPAGAYVDVLDCGGSWCRVHWQGAEGFVSASYLASSRGYVAPPAYYYGPPPRPPVVFGFGFGWGGSRWHDHRGWRGDWHHHRR